MKAALLLTLTILLCISFYLRGWADGTSRERLRNTGVYKVVKVGHNAYIFKPKK